MSTVRPLVYGTFTCLLWHAFIVAPANARVMDKDFFDVVPKYNYHLEPRQAGSCEIVACLPCDSSGCGGSKSKRRRHLYDVLPDTNLYNMNFTMSEAISGSEHRLVKRVFQEVDQSNVGQYIEDQNDSQRVLDLDGRYPNGTQISFTRQLRFQDHISTDPPGILMGTGQTLLTGCVVLTIVSRRAVYMGHFWQPWAFLVTKPDWMDGPQGANLIENVFNLIAGRQPLYYASGDALDVSLFNQEEDLPYAYLLAPRYPSTVTDQNNPNPAQIYYYWNQIQQISDCLQGLIPNLQTFLPIPYVADTKYPQTQLYRGQALFEYDPDADKKENGDWRLFYEESTVRGRSLGQDVVGVNRPT